jgi:hypothetical protein
VRLTAGWPATVVWYDAPLEVYHGRYLRPLRDHMVGSLESMLPVLGKMRWLYNLMIDGPPLDRKREGVGRRPGTRLNVGQKQGASFAK